jgi:hypothetical protein
MPKEQSLGDIAGTLKCRTRLTQPPNKALARMNFIKRCIFIKQAITSSLLKSHYYTYHTAPHRDMVGFSNYFSDSIPLDSAKSVREHYLDGPSFNKRIIFTSME